MSSELTTPRPAEMSPTVGELAKALARAQGVMRPAKKERSNPFFKSSYADLATLWETARSALSDNGMAVIQSTEFADGEMFIVTVLLHESGEWVRGRYRLKPVKDDPQSVGSAITYARRYALSAMVGITSEDEDDDGNAATGLAARRRLVDVRLREALCDEVVRRLNAAESIEAVKEAWSASTPSIRAVLSMDDTIAERLREAKDRRKRELEQKPALFAEAG
jgi:hypothetical protein